MRDESTGPNNRKLLWDSRKPCKSCPYRTDAPLNLWSDEEFQDLLDNERSQMGTTYGCHKFRKKHGDAQVCVGWLLNQRAHGVPSLILRMNLIRNDAALACYNEASSPVELYGSMEEMCAANGVERND